MAMGELTRSRIGGPVTISVSEACCTPQGPPDAIQTFQQSALALSSTLLQQQQAGTLMLTHLMRDTLPFTPAVQLVVGSHGWRDGAFTHALSAQEISSIAEEIVALSSGGSPRGHFLEDTTANLLAGHLGSPQDFLSVASDLASANALVSSL